MSHDETTKDESYASDTKSLNEKTPLEDTFAEGEVFAFDNVSLNEQSGSDMESANKHSIEAKDLATKGVIYVPPAQAEFDENEADYQKAMDHLKQRGNDCLQSKLLTS